MATDMLHSTEEPYAQEAMLRWLHTERVDICRKLTGVDHDLLWTMCDRADSATGRKALYLISELSALTRRSYSALRRSTVRLELLGLLVKDEPVLLVRQDTWPVRTYRICRPLKEELNPPSP